MDCINTKPGAVVYFAEVENTIKIGVSLDVTTRIEELRSGTGKLFSVLGVIHGGYCAEGSLHRRFRDYRLYGEYFSRASGLMDFIESFDRAKPCYGCVHELGGSNILQKALDTTTRSVIVDAIKLVGNSNAAISKRIGMSKRNIYRVRRKLGV